MFQWMKKWKPTHLTANGEEDAQTTSEIIEVMKSSDDFIDFNHTIDTGKTLVISYYETMVRSEYVHRDILSALTGHEITNLQKAKEKIAFEDSILTSDVKTIEEKLMVGYILIREHRKDSKGLLIPAINIESRQVSKPETEYTVVGPKEAFVESLDKNLNLVRKRLPLPKLKVKEVRIGKLSKTKVAVLYIDGIADTENVNTVIQRLSDIEYDQITDSSFLTQMIADNVHSPFPQLIDTERPDRASAVLAEGKVAILMDGSPSALTGPTTLTEFFTSFEDYFFPWHTATILRIMRLFAVMFSVLSTPTYVAVLTYHYQIIPQDLLGTLISSRRDIPFPPIIEAIILELAIELLREAAARLPTKIGQTIGIVGGIVIGTAAVEAGLTSNVLLIVVALAALSSFTTPIYQIGNTIRFLRFPFLLFAQLWGLIGVVFALAIATAHLLRLTSLGRPYLEPLYPPRWKDLKDAFVRLPFNKQAKRPLLVRAEDENRMNPKRANRKNDDRE